ncbi:cyclic nucleotide-binding domain-containing protein [Acidimangrovimonas pyrenivorans]|uniref:Cyclic nucleotide-binding domain-containing protein n=1 Tax=Acidimangrovimonas pyrenivorans TaxID=2030798 RepID=A0ABV7AGQ8_9RHOB
MLEGETGLCRLAPYRETGPGLTAFDASLDTRFARKDTPMRAEDVPEMRKLPLFSGMQQDNFEALSRCAYVQTFPPQLDLISEGEPSDFLHILVEGRVELLASWKRNETILTLVPPLSTFILAATIRDAPYLMSARTIDRSRVVLLPSEDVRRVFETDNAFARGVVAELAQCYHGVVRHAKELKLRTSMERLANYILRQSRGQTEFELDIEKTRLASYLNMTAENLSRSIRALQPYGVKITGANVTIEAPAELKRFAKPSQLIDDSSN